MQKRYLFLMVFFVFYSVSLIQARKKYPICVKELERKKTYYESLKKWQPKNCFVANAIKDIAYLHKELFTWDTFKTVGTIFPIYMGTRMLDETIQSSFYHGHCIYGCHQDRNQLPEWVVKIAQYSIVPPIFVMFGSLFVAKTEEFRTTSWLFLLGMPFVIFGKDVLKKIQFDAAQRPWRQKFCGHERAMGGFPSGHVAQATYLTALYGMRYGARFAGILAASTLFLTVSFLNCNRHYPSQMVGGAGIGVIFAYAANKVIDYKIGGDSLKLGLDTTLGGDPAVSVGWHF